MPGGVLTSRAMEDNSDISDSYDSALQALEGACREYNVSEQVLQNQLWQMLKIPFAPASLVLALTAWLMQQGNMNVPAGCAVIAADVLVSVYALYSRLLERLHIKMSQEITRQKIHLLFESSRDQLLARQILDRQGIHILDEGLIT